MAISMSSGGIIFPGTFADASDVNTLDDYEEGITDDPTVRGSGNETQVTRASNYHKWVRVGKCLTVNWHCQITGAHTGTGGVSVNLPMIPTNYSAWAIRSYSVAFVTSKRQFFSLQENDGWALTQEAATGTITNVWTVANGYYYTGFAYVAPYDADWPN